MANIVADHRPVRTNGVCVGDLRRRGDVIEEKSTPNAQNGGYTQADARRGSEEVSSGKSVHGRMFNQPPPPVKGKSDFGTRLRRAAAVLDRRCYRSRQQPLLAPLQVQLQQPRQQLIIRQIRFRSSVTDPAVGGEDGGGALASAYSALSAACRSARKASLSA